MGDRVLEQATDALRDPDEYGDGDNLGLEDLFAERTGEGLELRPQTQEMDSSWSERSWITWGPRDNIIFLYDGSFSQIPCRSV